MNLSPVKGIKSHRKSSLSKRKVKSINITIPEPWKKNIEAEESESEEANADSGS